MEKTYGISLYNTAIQLAVGHIFLYQLVLMVPGLLFTEWTRTV